MNIQTFPEIDSLNLKQVRAALALGLRNYGALKPEARPELAVRMAALLARKRQLEEAVRLRRILARKGGR